jgi:hypothetical protein
MVSPPSSSPPTEASRWRGPAAAVVRGFHTYANWLVGITWRRFIVLSLLLLIASGVLSELPPFNWAISERVSVRDRSAKPAPAKPPKPPAAPSPGETTSDSSAPAIIIEEPAEDGGGRVEISIGEKGIRVHKRPGAASAAAEAASAAEQAASAAEQAGELRIDLPAGADSAAVREALRAARDEIRAAVEEAKRDAEEARREAVEAAADAAEALSEPDVHIQRVTLGEVLPQTALLWIIASMIIKITYKGRMQAEVKAAQATETAEAESLKRQVIEARMAAMQAQVEPHFLFNTLASIDHLIETDPPRASQMQKHLIALLRASMPTMREANAQGTRSLGGELAVIRPYLEILKVRMEDRLQVEIDAPEGLHSAAFPPMMLQSMVENAIKHGLEPKAEGGRLRVKAEVRHGKLVVSVADTGLGFGRAATAGTGTGLANIRERLALLYGRKAELTITANEPSGTVVAITVPYAAQGDDLEKGA